VERCLACEAVVNRETSSHNTLARAVLYRLQSRIETEAENAEISGF